MSLREFEDLVYAATFADEDNPVEAWKTVRRARRLGELGIGTNMRLQRFTKNILLDEKIVGTIHFALGKS